MMRPEEVDKIEAETERTLCESEKLKSETLLMNINFLSVWLIVWVIATGLVKLEFMQEVSKWING